jgi:outer membrane protein OmpA-like peptidoglycan-associated protein
MLHFFSKYFIPALLLLSCFHQNGFAQQGADSGVEVLASREVYFNFGQHELRTDDLARLDSIIALLETQEAVIIKITAHTDAIGTDGANQQLSQKRGEAVRQFLITKGVPDSLLQVAVYGETTPAADNESEQGRQRNRRATVDVLRKPTVKQTPSTTMSHIEGTVVDKETGLPIFSTVIIRGKTFRDSTQTDLKGYFKRAVPLNEVIGVDVYAPGYFFETQMMKVTGLKLPTLEFRLPPAAVGAIAEIKDLFYEGNKAVLLKKSEPILLKVLLFMQMNKDIKIEIGGHVNYPKNNTGAYIKGAGPFEQELSDNRAKMVYDFLVANGIAKERMRWKGYSNTQMKFPYTKEEREMAQNRRVEIKVLE